MVNPMIFSARPFMAAVTCLFVVAVQAQTPPAATMADASGPANVQLLQRIQSSAQNLDYAGVFTYQQGAAMQSSRVTHISDDQGEHERLEVLDGQPMEFLRHDDEVQCLIPHKRAILIEKRTARDRFPGLMQQGKAEQLAQHYSVSVDPQSERVADRDCQVINLQPKDGDRYGYRLCADTSSGLLLKAQTLARAPAGGDPVVVEQVSFITLYVGGEIDPKQLKSRWSTKDWKVVRANLTPTDLAAHGWSVGEPAGFHQVTQVQRSIGGKPDVKQVMLSDGLAAISIFIEPFSPTHPQQVGSSSRGAIHVVGRRLGDYWITVLGEAPLATIQQVAQSINYKPVSRNP
jgi:sigma-E factor negative regulatory protein RseB